jgi:hypothetical protein
MKFSMFAAVWKQCQVLETVIVSNFIVMVDDFFRIKKSSQVFFHDQSMFWHIIINVLKRMIAGEDVNITINMANPSFPCRTFFLNIFSFKGLADFKAMFKGMFNSNISFISALIRAIISKPFFNNTWFNLKYVATNLTLTFNLFVRSILVTTFTRTIFAINLAGDYLKCFPTSGTFAGDFYFYHRYIMTFLGTVFCISLSNVTRFSKKFFTTIYAFTFYHILNYNTNYKRIVYQN